MKAWHSRDAPTQKRYNSSEHVQLVRTRTGVISVVQYHIELQQDQGMF